MNVLELIRAVCGTIGIQRPSSVVGSGDVQVVQLGELLNEEGSELASRYDWSRLIREATFNTLAQEDQGELETIIGAPNAYRHIVNETIWNRTTKEPIYGPRAPRIWQGFKALVVTGPYPEYRIRGGNLLMIPTPSAGDSCYFEYVTKNWIESSDGVSQRSRIANDEDVFLLDDELIRQGVIWRWRAAKGLDFSSDYQKYESRVIDAMAKDGTKPRLSLDDRYLPGSVQEAIPRLIGS